MTRTEGRLADALDAVARSVKEESLPPLPARSPSPARQRWGRWLAPAAAAASVVLIVVLVSVVHLFSAKPPGRPAQPSGPPRYYAAVIGRVSIQIHKTATGALTETIPNPYSSYRSPGMLAAGVAATDGGREFVAAYIGVPPHGTTDETRLYSFRINSAGHASRLSPVRGGVITGLQACGPMSVSPDGSKVALALAIAVMPGRPAPQPEIVVINRRTGERRVWSGGLQRHGLLFSVQDISWGPGRGSLAFLAQWCQHAGAAVGFCDAGRHAAEVRTLRLATGGGRLSAGGVLLRESARYPNIAQALLSPGGRALTIVVLHGSYTGKAGSKPYRFQVVQVPLTGGGSRLLYRGRVGNHVLVFLGSDATGRYLILAWRLNGWLDHGVLRALAPQSGTAFAEAW
jgi:hypothetical protein